MESPTPILFYMKHRHLKSKAFFGPQETINKKQKRVFIFVMKQKWLFSDFSSIPFINFASYLEKYQILRSEKGFLKRIKKISLLTEAFPKSVLPLIKMVVRGINVPICLLDTLWTYAKVVLDAIVWSCLGSSIYNLKLAIDILDKSTYGI